MARNGPPMNASVLPPLQQIPADVACLDDYAALARPRMSEAAWAYVNGAAADELTLADNVAGFRRLKLLPRVLREFAGGHAGLTLFGRQLDYPVLLAPIAFQKLAHPQGELATAVAAGAAGAAMVVSTQASHTLEDIAQAAGGPLWFQLYIQPDRAFTRDLVARAEAAGYEALVVTVDAPVNGVRNREQRAGFALPPGVEAANLRGMRSLPPHTAAIGQSAVFGSPHVAAAPGWKDLEWLAGITRLPVLAKGILAPADALRAADCGAAGLIVSNHGGRTLDTVPATIDALPRIARALDGRLPLLLDGGIRRGTDVLKALALGATAVLLGRPYLHGLAAAGALGVAHVLHLLRAELEAAMVLSGCRTLADIDAGLLWDPA